MVFAIKFGSPDEAAEEEYSLRDGWGSEINTAVSGDTVYVEGGDLAKKIVNDWYPSNNPKLVDPPEDIAKMLHGVDEAMEARTVVPKFIQINTQADYNKYIKPALGMGADAYGLEDIKGMWWELDDGTRLGAAKTMREIRDGIDKRPRIIFISGAGAERGITDMFLTEYAENMGMRVKDYLNGYAV